MKSAGWLSPMMNSLNCPAASVPTACAKKSATGAACHEALFGDSCVPGMYADIQGTAMTTGQMCKQCGTKGGKTGDCSEAEYSNYNGAINGLMKDSCDVAFVKTVTIDCGAVDAGTVSHKRLLSVLFFCMYITTSPNLVHFSPHHLTLFILFILFFFHSFFFFHSCSFFFFLSFAKQVRQEVILHHVLQLAPVMPNRYT